MENAIPLKFKEGEKVTSPVLFTIQFPSAVRIEFWMPAMEVFKSTDEASIVPSMSVSVLVMLNTTFVSSFVVAELSSAMGGTVAATEINNVSLLQMAGNGIPWSQI